jgi:predicted transposase YbfD/YdcC
MVSAWGCEQRLVLAQIATDAKSNEITAVPKLLAMLRLKGTIVTADALNCQRAIAQQIVDQGGDYALALKGNQGTLHDDVVLYLDDPASKAITAEPVVDADHGRIETRTATVSTDIAWLNKDHHWPGLAAVGKVERLRQTAGKTTSETAYYLLSAPLTPERFNEVVRSHWGVENRLHWRLDVVMNEDSGPEPFGKRSLQSRRSTMQSYKSGDRPIGPKNEDMKKALDALSDQDLQHVALYYALQSENLTRAQTPNDGGTPGVFDPKVSAVLQRAGTQLQGRMVVHVKIPGATHDHATLRETPAPSSDCSLDVR